MRPHALAAVGRHGADVRNPVLQRGQVTAHVVAPVAVHLLPPVHAQLEAAVADLALVDHHGRNTDVVGPVGGLRLDQVVGALHEEVGRDRQTAPEHVEVETDVGLLRRLPREVGVDGRTEVHEVRVGRTAHLRTVAVAVAVEDGIGVGIGHGAEVTHAAPRSTQLEQRHHVVLAEERLARNLPAAGHCGEVAALVALGQTARIVAAPRSGHEVTVVEAVRQTGHDGHVVVGIAVRVLGIGELRGVAQVLVGLGLVVEVAALHGEAALALLLGRGRDQGAHGVTAERIVVGQRILGTPVVVVVGVVRELVARVGLAGLGNAGREVLVEVVLVAVGEAAVEAQTRQHVLDRQLRGG